MTPVSDHVDALIYMVGGLMVALVGVWAAEVKARRKDRDAAARRSRDEHDTLIALRAEVATIRDATTKNHHESAAAGLPPTIPDRLDTLTGMVTEVKATQQAQHAEQRSWNERQDARLHDGSKHMQRLDDLIARYHGGTA